MTGPARQLGVDEDTELVQRFLDGSAAAFEALVVRHQNRVFGLCMRLLGSRTYAEEAAQEVFVKVYRNLARFRGESKFTTWLYRVTLNHCRNVQAYRARRHEKRHDSLDAEREGENGPRPKRELPSGDATAEEQLLAGERLRFLRDEMSRLDPIWQEILLLRDVEGLSYEEIGGALELAAGTVKSRIHRARGELRKRLVVRLRQAETT